MSHFFNPSQQYYISTNYKVLYTLLYHQVTLQAIAGPKMDLAIYQKRCISFWRRPHVLLVRNPYQRVVSFYKDKFRLERPLKLYHYDELQYCQRLFCQHLQINQHDSPYAIREKLLNLSFSQFIELLPSVYQLDGHLHPQALATRVYFRGRPMLPLKFSKILKVESTDNLRYMQETLGLDLSQKYNSTSKIQLPNPWSPRLRVIVNKLYQDDFEMFDYEIHTI